jgi:hypothetical protein
VPTWAVSFPIGQQPDLYFHGRPAGEGARHQQFRKYGNALAGTIPLAVEAATEQGMLRSATLCYWLP